MKRIPNFDDVFYIIDSFDFDDVTIRKMKVNKIEKYGNTYKINDKYLNCCFETPEEAVQRVMVNLLEQTENKIQNINNTYKKFKDKQKEF